MAFSCRGRSARPAFGGLCQSDGRRATINRAYGVAVLVTAALRAYDPFMGIAEDILGQDGWHAALAALAWQYDLGVTEVIGDAPTERYGLADPVTAQKATVPVSKAAPVAPVAPAPDPTAQHHAAVEVARATAARAGDLDQLRHAVDGFPHCDLRRGARNLVFCDGNPLAAVMIVTEVPQRDEDQVGRPLVGPVGALFDKMFAAIGLSRSAQVSERSLYIASVLPWKPPGERPATGDEISMMRPFLERHIAIQDPQVIVAMGNKPMFALTGREGIMRARGQWFEAFGRPVLAMQHPGQLMNDPGAKRQAWADLLALQAKLRAR